MDGKVFAHALANTKGEQLRLVYSLLFKTNTLDLLSAKTKDLFNKEVDHLSASLQQEMKTLEKFDDGALQLQLLMELSRALNLRGIRLDTIDAIELMSDEIMHATHFLVQQEDANYAAFVEHANEPVYQSIVHFEMQKLFSTFEEKYRQLNEEQSLQFANKLVNLISELPENMQQLIMKQIQIDELSEENIHQCLQKEGTILVLSTIVEYVGFSAYATLTSAIASTLSFSGVALPFGMYTFAAALLSLVLNPLFLIPIVFGGGNYLLGRQNKSIQKKLLPIGIVQILLPVISNAQKSIGTPDFEPILLAWQEIDQRHANFYYKREELLKNVAAAEQNITALQATIRDYTKQQEIVYKHLQHSFTQIKENTALIPEHQQSILYKRIALDIDDVHERLQNLKRQQEQNKQRTGFWQSISATVDNTKISTDIRKQQKEIEELHASLINEVISMQPDVLQEWIDKYNGFDFEHKTLQNSIQNEQQTLQLVKNELTKLQQDVKLIDKQLKALEKQYYGLGHHKTLLP